LYTGCEINIVQQSIVLGFEMCSVEKGTVILYMLRTFNIMKQDLKSIEYVVVHCKASTPVQLLFVNAQMCVSVSAGKS
jgi:hypothetical protein